MAIHDIPELDAGGNKGRWLQLGILSATVTAPLIARWRSLRAADRAQALRERAEALRQRAEARFPGAARTARAFQQSLQRPHDRRGPDQASEAAPGIAAPEPALPLAPLTVLAATAPIAIDDRGRRAMRASLWLVGVSAGLIAAGAITYIIIRNRAIARVEQAVLVEATLERVSSSLPTEPEPGERPVTQAAPAHEPGLAPPPVFSEEDGEGADWVGDIYTRAYMPVASLDSAALPEHSRRIYFASEAQARAAGYHRAGEAPSERE